MRFLLLITLSSTLPAVGFSQQNGGSPPVQAKRLPPEKAKPSAKDANGAMIDRYDFGAQLSALQDSNAPQKGATTASGSAESTKSPVPPDFKPKMDVQLTKTAEEAVQMSAKWMAEHNQPAVGHDGRVLYSYGTGLPTVVCAPLRVCMIELQSGEKLVGEPQIGDSVRWNLSPAMYGTG